MPQASDRKLSPEEFDQIFMAILAGQIDAAMNEAAACTQSVFDLSARYIEQPTFEALKGFQVLYFNSINDVAKSEVIAEVDVLFDQLQAQLEAGEELSYEEDEEAKQRRLTHSAVQKKQKSLGALSKEHEDINAFISPILSNLQFQDRLRQNLDNILKMLKLWQDTRKTVGAGLNQKDLLEFGKKLTQVTTMKRERDVIRAANPGLDPEVEVDSVLLF